MFPNVTRITGLHIIKPLEGLKKRQTKMPYRSGRKEYIGRSALLRVSSWFPSYHKIYILTAHKQEIRDFNLVVTIAIITIIVSSPGITNAAARTKLKAYITQYVGNRPHNIYLHENSNKISATIIFNASSYKEIDISKEVEAL